jgi:hypothetical protein
VGRILELFEINMGFKLDTNLHGEGGEGSISEGTNKINNNIQGADRAFFQIGNRESTQ